MIDKVNKLSKDLFQHEVGQHATPDEVSITQYLLHMPSIVNTTSIPSLRYSNSTSRRSEVIVNESWTDELLEQERIAYTRMREYALTYMDPIDFKQRFPDGRSVVYICNYRVSSRYLFQ
jgi:hypothetical protein